MKNGILALSGGLDSTTLLGYLLNQDYDITIALCKYGSKHNVVERQYALNVIKFYEERIGKRLSIIDIDLSFMNQLFIEDSALMQNDLAIPKADYDVQNIKQTTVPFRNGIIVSVLAGIAEANDLQHVFLGTHKGRTVTYPDCTVEFNQAMSEAISYGTHNNVTLITPFQDLTKSDIVTIGSQLGVPFELTWSCYQGGKMHCGECATCRDRKKAFIEAKVTDPTKYLS